MRPLLLGTAPSRLRQASAPVGRRVDSNASGLPEAWWPCWDSAGGRASPPPRQALAGSSLSYSLPPSPMGPSLPWARHLPVLLLRMQPWAAWCQPESPWEPGVRPGPAWKAGALGSGRLGPELRRGSGQDRRPSFALLLLQAGVASACPPRSPLPDGFSLVLYLQLNGTLDNRPL